MNIEEYSHPAFLDDLQNELREAVLRFIYTGETCSLLDEALMRSPELRTHIDSALDKELEKYGQKDSKKNHSS